MSIDKFLQNYSKEEQNTFAEGAVHMLAYSNKMPCVVGWYYREGQSHFFESIHLDPEKLKAKFPDLDPYDAIEGVLARLAPYKCL